MPIDVLIRLLGQDAGGKRLLTDTKKEGENLDRTLTKVGANSGLRQQEQHAKRYLDGVKQAKKETENLTEVLDRVRNVSLGIAAAGGVGVILSNNFSKAYTEADRLGGKMESLLKGKGLGNAIGEVRKLGNEIAGLRGLDDDEVGAGIAGAIASGRLTALKEYGIVIDEAGQKNIEAAAKISEHAKAQATLNEVLRAGKTAADNMRTGMDASTVAMGEASVQFGNLEEGLGKGATKVKAAIYTGILKPILDVVEESPQLQETAGAVFMVGSTAVTAAGSVGTLATQVIATRAHLTTMGIVGTTSMNAITTSAGRTALAVGKIALVALAAAAALYGVDRALHFREDKKLRENIEKGKQAEMPLYEAEQSARAKRGQPRQTFEEWKGIENEDDLSDTDAQEQKLQRQQERMEAMMARLESGATAPAMSSIISSIAPIVTVSDAVATAAKAAPQSSGFSLNGVSGDVSGFASPAVTQPASSLASIIGLMCSGAGVNALGQGARNGGGVERFEKSFTLSPKDFHQSVLPDGTKEFTFNVTGTFRTDDRLARSAASYGK